MAYEYVSGGAGDELTARWNREAFHGIRLRPRALIDVSKIDTRVRLFGQELPHPVLLAPTAYHRLVHGDGELATARGAGAAQATFVVSTMATFAVEEIAREATAPLWFQLYLQEDRGFAKALIQRAEAAGCQALCVTVDTPVVGTRYREIRCGFSLPTEMERPHLRGLQTSSTSHRPPEGEIYSSLFDANMTWKDIEWMLSFARVPVLLKGLMSADDAEEAVQAGVAGVIVSNHGGRNLDTAPATIEVLPEIAGRVAGRIAVLMDGGIRRGTDVLKAMALGADAVLIGRPYLYGLGTAGAAGVARVVNLLRAEFEMAMALCGRTSAASLDASVLWDQK